MNLIVMITKNYTAKVYYCLLVYYRLTLISNHILLYQYELIIFIVPFSIIK